MGPADVSLRAEQDDAAELLNVASRATLSQALRASPRGVLEHSGVDQSQPAAVHAQRAIDVQLRVNQQRHGERVALREPAGGGEVTAAYEDDSSADGLKLCAALGGANSLFATEDSTEVPEQDDQQRFAVLQIT